MVREPGIFVGYSKDSSCYMVKQVSSGKVYARRYADVEFDERPKSGSSTLSISQSIELTAKASKPDGFTRRGRKAPFQRFAQDTRANIHGTRVHTDMKTLSKRTKNGYKICLVIVDDATRKREKSMWRYSRKSPSLWTSSTSTA